MQRFVKTVMLGVCGHFVLVVSDDVTKDQRPVDQSIVSLTTSLKT